MYVQDINLVCEICEVVSVVSTNLLQANKILLR